MTVDPERLLGVLADNARRLVSDYAVSDAVHDLAEGVQEVLDLRGAGVSLISDGRLEFATAHPEFVTTVERVQEQTQTGPCVEAYHAGQRVSVADIGAERDRWPELAEVAARSGLVAVAGIPMHLNGTALGVLNLYDDKARAWDDDDLRAAEVLAAMATGLVVNANRLDEARTTAEQLQGALDSRVIIEQAKGVIAAELDIPVDEAFDRLRSHARRHQIPMRSVAEAVVNVRLRLDDGAG